MFAKGLILGLINLLLWPVWFLVVAFCVLTKRPFPKVVLTPDDTVSPFGTYEASVRTIYEKLGSKVGDLYWLGIRNVGYGFLYFFKPNKYKDTTDYSTLERTVLKEGRVTTYTVDNLIQKDLDLGLFVFRGGWKVDGVFKDPFTKRQPINMEFRPTFTVRTKRTA